MAATPAIMAPGVNPSAVLNPKNTRTMPHARSTDESARFTSFIVGYPRPIICYLVLAPRSPHHLMATCPRCKGHLTDSHRCPRRPVVVAAEIVVTAVIGGVAGLLLVVMFDPTGR